MKKVIGIKWKRSLTLMEIILLEKFLNIEPQGRSQKKIERGAKFCNF